MFCSNCGKKIADDQKFCAGCGKPVFAAPVSQSVSAPQPVSTIPATEFTGNKIEPKEPAKQSHTEVSASPRLLAEGNGKGNSYIGKQIMVAVMTIIVLWLMGFVIAPQVYDWQKEQRLSQSSMGGFGGVAGIYVRNVQRAQADAQVGEVLAIVKGCVVILMAISLAMAIWVITGIPKTCIKVYEDRIEGSGFGKNFKYGDPTRTNFHLTYDRLTSIETNANAITVIVSNTHYKCHVSNPDAIRDAIFNQQKRLGHVNK